VVVVVVTVVSDGGSATGVHDPKRAVPARMAISARRRRRKLMFMGESRKTRLRLRVDGGYGRLPRYSNIDSPRIGPRVRPIPQDRFDRLATASTGQ
jgi:hypothetical protein